MINQRLLALWNDIGVDDPCENQVIGLSNVAKTEEELMREEADQLRRELGL